ncbi:MAG: hypothetical protein ACLFWD_00990 [Anaerolineales bacterium]
MKLSLRPLTPWLVSTFALAARLLPSPRTIDDAYITFRYARNLLAGHGLVFNPGEAVLGTTTPLYSILMAGLGAIFGGAGAPFPEIAWITNAALDAAGCFLLILIGRKLGSELAGLSAGIIWAIAPMSVTFAIGGMETSLFITLLLATYYLALDERFRLAALSGAMLLLTRPDGLLFIGPLAIERLRQRWPEFRERRLARESILELAFFLLPLLLWGLVAWLYYGSPIPHSVAAKVSAYRLPPTAGLVRLLQHFGTPFLGHLTFGPYWIAVGLFLFPVLFFLGAMRALRRRADAWPLLLSPWLYMLVYAFANPLLFRWYLAPPLPFYFMGIFLGVDRISKDLRSNLPSIAAVAAATFLTLIGWTFSPDHGPDRPAPEMAFTKLELMYEEVARELRDDIQSEEVLAAADVGALGYYSEATILDTLGIVSPQSTRFYPTDPDYYVINYAIPPELVVELAPDYLVILEVYGREGLLVDSQFVADYSLRRTLQTDIYGSRGMLVFIRANKP